MMSFAIPAPAGNEFEAIFDVLLGSTPFLGIVVTFAVYYGADRLHEAIGAPVFLHPLLIAIAALIALLQFSGVSYERYYLSAEPLHLLLGPVVVLLAVPLWRELSTIRTIGPGLLFVLLAGSVAGIATSIAAAIAFSAPAKLVASMAPRSVTTPVAINLSESLGGVPSITAVLVILTGLFGATIGWPLLRVLGIRDPRAKGFAVGVAAHVIGTARMFQINPTAGAFSSLGMILNALMTAILISLARIALT
jgi:predicted murein hydrolase (TIGR00659 family)